MLIQTIPPPVATPRISSSEILRLCEAKALQQPWVYAIGLQERSRTSLTVLSAEWATSMSILARFISETSSLPNGLSPPQVPTPVQLSPTWLSALWVSVTYRTPLL